MTLHPHHDQERAPGTPPDGTSLVRLGGGTQVQVPDGTAQNLIHTPSVDDKQGASWSVDTHNHPKGSTTMPVTKLRNEAAEMLGVKPPTITAWIRRRWLKGVLIGRRWHVSVESIEHVLRHGTPPQPLTSPRASAHRGPSRAE